MILHGKPVQERVLAEVKVGVDKLKAARGVTPTLAVVLIGGDPASHVYVGHKRRAADAVGIVARDELHPEGFPQAKLNALLRSLSDDPTVHGILLQLPLPKGLDEATALACIAPEKDVDGLHPTNLGRLLAGEPGIVPCTPSGCLEILAIRDRYLAARGYATVAPRDVPVEVLRDFHDAITSSGALPLGLAERAVQATLD